MGKTLENILKGIKKGAKALGAAAAFAALAHGTDYQLKASDENIEQGKVVVSLKCIDAQTGEETREVVPGRNYYLQVIGDNRGLKEKTSEFRWGLFVLDDLNIVDIPQPTPHYNGYLGPDFFEEFRMHPLLNKVRLDNSDRYSISTSGVSIGPTNKAGVVGNYLITPINDPLSRQQKTRLINISVLGGTSPISLQLIKIKNLSVAIGYNINDTNRAPILLMDKDEELSRYNFYGTKMGGKKLVLQSATNLPNGEWTDVYTNEVPGEPLITSQPTSTIGSKFYRLRTLN